MRLTEKDDMGHWFLKGLEWGQLREGQVITKAVAQKLYGALCKLKDYEDTGGSPNYIEDVVTGYTRAIVDVAELIQKCGWIPVKERLPEEEKLVLVTCQAKTGNVSVNRAYYANSFWHGSGSMAGVTAWMPLPEPYRAEKEEKPAASTEWKDHYMGRFEKVE